jgi:ParB family chromosome partitioning protein
MNWRPSRPPNNRRLRLRARRYFECARLTNEGKPVMSKRKRLTSPLLNNPTIDSDIPDLESKSIFPSYPLGVAPKPATRAPIAQVAGDAAMQSALDELASEMTTARRTGKMVQALPLDAIRDNHLVRDRMITRHDDMDSLISSLRARGQQMPVEVVALEDGVYGLVSGWRRLRAIRVLYGETGEKRFATVAALVKPMDGASDSYVAMVEENEIRANPSFYERAHLVCEAVRLGVYPNTSAAIKTLFANTTSARRSKIASFVRLYDALGGVLRFPAEIPEKLGLALVNAMGKDAAMARRLKDALRKSPADSVEAERATLEGALRKPSARNLHTEVAPGVKVTTGKGKLVLSGRGVTPALQSDLQDWLRNR